MGKKLTKAWTQWAVFYAALTEVAEIIPRTEWKDKGYFLDREIWWPKMSEFLTAIQEELEADSPQVYQLGKQLASLMLEWQRQESKL